MSYTYRITMVEGNDVVTHQVVADYFDYQDVHDGLTIFKVIRAHGKGTDHEPVFATPSFRVISIQRL